MESPEKKQQTSSVFNNQSQQQPPAGPIFNCTSSQSIGKDQYGGGGGGGGGALFGSQNGQASASNGIFGGAEKAPEKKDEQPSGGLFGQGNPAFGSTQTQKPLFGASQPSSGFNFSDTASKPAFSLGPNTSQPATSTPFKFGGASTVTQPSTPISFGGANPPATAPGKPLFNFDNNQADKPATNLFGAPQSEKPPEPKSTGFIFGQPASSQPSANKPANASTPAFSFGATTTFGAPKGTEDKPAEKSNVWANVPKAPKPVPQPAKPTESSNGHFGRVSKAPDSEPEQVSEEPKNLFGSLFGTKPPTTMTESEKPKSSPFSFPSAATPSGPTSRAPNAPSQTSSLFGNISKAPSNPSSLFSNLNKPTDPNKEAPALDKDGSDAPASDTPDKVSNTPDFTGSMYDPDTPCPMGPPAKRLKSGTLKYIPTHITQISEDRRKELFAQIPKAAGPPKQYESKINPNYQEQTSGQSSAPSSVAPSTESSKKRLFDSYRSDATPSQLAAPAPVVDQLPLSSFGSSAVPTAPAPKSTPATTTPKLAPTGQVAKKPIFAQAAASSIPGHLNSEGYKEFDSQDKLRSLNRDFRKKIIAVDVGTHDIDTLLRVYVAARNSIGADIGLYHRTTAGTKRKNDQPEDPVVPSAYKKVRSEGPEPTSAPQPTTSSALPNSTAGPSLQSSAPTTSASNNIFGNISQAPKPAAPSPTKPAEQNRASQILDGMIPKSPGKTPSQPQQSPEKPRNVFGGIQPLPGKAGPSFGSPAKPVGSSAPPPSMPVFGQSATSTTPSKPAFGFQPSTTPAKSPPKASGFHFSGAVGDGFSAFGQKAETGYKKRRAEELEDEYSSSEESQAEGKKLLEERERSKRAKYESIAKTGFKPNFGSAPASASKPSPKKSNPFEPDSSGSEKADDEETSDDVDNAQQDGDFDPEEEEDEDEEEASEEDNDSEEEDDDDDDEAPQGGEDDIVATDPSREPTPDQISREIAENPNKGRSIFDRVQGLPRKTDENPNGNNGIPAIMNSATKPGWKPAPKFAGLGKSTPEQPTFSPFTPDPNFKPATTFNFNNSAPTTPNTDNTSVLGGAAAKFDPKFDGLFGSRPSTPSQLDRPTNGPNSMAADHTWKQGSPIRFGTSTPDKNTDAPKFSFTAPSPSNKDGADDTPRPFGNLFGKPAPDSASKPDGSLGFSFGQSSTTPAPGFLSAAPHLGVGGSATSSALSSRASSPGLTDNESVATDVTDTDEAPPPSDTQAKYNESRAGEEDEETVYEVPTVKALRLTNDKTASKKDPVGTWVTMGQGPLRLLKNKDGKTRLVLRNSTNGNIILNEYLQPKLAWSVQNQANGKTGAVKGFIAQSEGLSQWVMKLKLGREGDLTEALEKERKAQGS